jgi:CHAT domain-containing protein/Tfp pilus assembly protein PilF
MDLSWIALAAALVMPQDQAAGDAARAARLVTEARRLLADGQAEAGRAEVLLQDALAVWRAAGNREKEAEVLRVLGQAAAYHHSPKALDYRLKAGAIWRELGDTTREASAQLAIGITYYSRGDIAHALEAFTRGLDLARAGGDRDLEASLLSNAANAYTWRGESQRALDAIEEASGIWHALGDWTKDAVIQRHRGSIYLRLGDASLALRCFRDSLRAARASKSRWEEGFTLTVMGDAYVEAGDDASAMSTYENALAVWRSFGAQRGEAGILGNIGLMHARRGQHALALDHYARSLDLARATGHRAAEAATLLNLGTLETSRGRPAAAVEALDGALALWREVGDRMGEASTLVALARLHRAGGDVALARTRLDAALAIVESIRGDVRAPDLRGSYLATARRAYEELIDALMTLDRIDPRGGHAAAALVTSERARARSLLDLLTAAHVTTASGEPLGLDDIRRRVLDDDSVLVEYALGAARSYAWVVTRDSLTGVALPPRARLDAAARRLHRLASAGHKRETEAQLRRTLDEVSALVVAPLASRLEGKRLLVVPDGALQYVPFGALTARSGGREVRLVDRFELVVLPSASAVAALRLADDRQPPSRTVAVIAGPRSGGAGAFAALPFARREADAIAALAQRTDTLIVQSGVGSLALAGARIVHFATHAVVDVHRPERSGIALEGRLLTLQDVYGLRLDADLVVLSACRTALGREVAGEGLVGLTRGFMYAGARSVVASLWDVSDAATATLMTRFYRGLFVDGLTPASALRAAQRSMAREPRWQAPYYWAGFELHGASR